MKISVVTPSFNQGQFIERTLRSVASQRNVPYEHLVFDGGSTDATVEVLERFDGPLRWKSEKDGGQADAVNQGIRASDGDIIGWLNSDDVYYPGAFERVAAFFEAHPEVDVVYGMADHIDREDRPFETYPSEPWDFERLKERCFICQPALFFRRSLVDRFGALDASLDYCMDYEYWLRLGKAGARFAYLREKLAGSRLYEETKTLGSRVRVHREINDMFRRLFGRVPDRWLFNYAHAVVESAVSREAHPTWFVARLGLSSVWAALRWNHGISRQMLETTLQWQRAARQTGPSS